MSSLDWCGNSSSLKGWNNIAQGNALGLTIFISSSLKGWNKFLKSNLSQPFRLEEIVLSPSQGVALGYVVPALWAENKVTYQLQNSIFNEDFNGYF
jgi:hypothetical protein